ncbi:hypothetical protein bcgnr5390_56230 [Bacillus luti]
MSYVSFVRATERYMCEGAVFETASFYYCRFWLMNWCISEIVDMIFLQLYCSENIRELEKC